MKKSYRSNRQIADKVENLLSDIYDEFGWMTKSVAPIIGLFLHFMLKMEEKRLAKGWTYEPQTFYEKNDAALAMDATRRASKNRWVATTKNYHTSF